MGNKKHNIHFIKTASVVVFLSLLILFFQNCGSNNIRFSDLKQSSLGDIDLPGSYTSIMGATSFPPLKLIMVLDNSASMTLHNNNLSAPLAAMFNSANNGNLSQFDTTIFVITTAQSSADTKYYPSTTVDQTQLAGMSLPVANALYRNKNISFLRNGQSVTINNGVTGEIPGDILGYRIYQSGTPSALTNSYRVAPMLFLNSSALGRVESQTGLFIPKGSSPSAIQDILAQQLNLLTYERRDFKFDNNTDGSVNKESGLCAIARVLRHNQGIINPGDVVSFLIASDEADNDPSGSKCIDSTTTSDGTTDLYDIDCRGSRFIFEKHACTYSFWSSYNIDYKYNYFPMNVSYKVESTIQLGDGFTDVITSDKSAVIDSTGLSCSNAAGVMSKLPPPGTGARILSINTCSVSSTTVSKSGNSLNLLFSSFSSEEPAVGNCLNNNNILNTIMSKNPGVSATSAINYCNISKKIETITAYPGDTTCSDLLATQCIANTNRRNCTITRDTYISDKKDDPSRAGLSCSSLASSTSIFSSQSGTVNDVITQNYFGRNCSSLAYASSSYTQKPVDFACAAGTTKVITKGPYRVSGTTTDYVAGTVNNVPKSNLITYIKNQSQALLGSTLPHVSVFDDTSISTSYDTLVTTFGGVESSISAQSYSAALNNLSFEISKRLSRSIQVPKMSVNQKVKQVSKNGIPLVQLTEWTSSGNTVTIDEAVLLQVGDQINIDYE